MLFRTILGRSPLRPSPPGPLRTSLGLSPSPTPLRASSPLKFPCASLVPSSSRYLSSTPIIQQQTTTSSADTGPSPAAPAVLLSKPPPRHRSPPQDVTSLTLSPPSPSIIPLSVSYPLLLNQPSHYITIHINSFPFLVTPGDLVTLPFCLKDVSVGDILRLTHASVLGSRDYTIKGAPYIDERLFELRARVVEITKEPMRTMVKKKQRCRRKKTVKSKHVYTVLRIGELVLNELPADGVEGVHEVVEGARSI